MMDEIRPTSDDLALDLLAALADVEAATPGPWNCAVRTDGTQGDAYLFAPTAPGHGGPSLLCLNPAGKAVFRTNEDARAVAAMSIAFPAAVRRALAAEEEVARLRAALEALWANAGGKLITDGDTTYSLGRWVNEVLKGGTR